MSEAQQWAKSEVFEDDPMTHDELVSEYLRIRPLLLEIVKDWGALREPSTGCPAMRHILRPR